MLFAQVNQGASGWMQTTAGSWYVLTQTNSATAIAFFTVVSMTPTLLLNPVGGRLMDQYSPMSMVRILAPLAAIGPLLISLLYFLDLLSVPMLLFIALLSGIPRALQAPTFEGILPLTVPDDQREEVLALSAVMFNLSRTVGPLLAGLVGVPWAYLLAGVGYLVVGLLVMVTPIPAPARDVVPTSERGGSSEYRDAVRLAWGVASLQAVFLGALLFYLVSGAMHQLLAAVAKSTSSTSLALGVLYASAAVGAIVANPPTVAHLEKGRDKFPLLVLAIGGVGAAALLFGLSSSLIADMLIMMVVGAVGEVMYVTAQRSIMIEMDQARSGAVLGLFLSLVAATAIIGSFGLSLLMDSLSVRGGLLWFGVGTVAVSIPVLIHVRRRLRGAGGAQRPNV